MDAFQQERISVGIRAGTVHGCRKQSLCVAMQSCKHRLPRNVYIYTATVVRQVGSPET